MSEAFAFGPFRLLVARRELLAHGVPVTLGQRAFEILLTLVSRHGQLVTKDELMAEVWPGVVVEENNIQVHISAVRKVLAAAGSRLPGAAIVLWRRSPARALRRTNRRKPATAGRACLMQPVQRSTIFPSS